MVKIFRLLGAALLTATLAWSPAWAQAIRINPVPPHVKPNWTKVPGTPQVYYAPNLPTDVFRYQGKYYFYWEGYFYRGTRPSGPWKVVTKVPPVFSDLDPSYFKTARKPEAPPPPTAAPERPVMQTPPPAQPRETVPGASGQPQEAPAPPPPGPEGAGQPPKVM